MTPDSIKTWLFTSAQISEGPDRGGIVGGFDEQGRANYVYGEISGYFLTFLAFVAATQGDNRCAPMAQGVVSWLAGQWGGKASPPTRVPVTQNETDWRNACIFSFDLAMILRGLALACEAGLVTHEACEGVAKAVAKELVAFIGPHGRLDACRLRDGCVADIPQRWSTLGGAFQTKTAAAVLSARSFGLPSGLEAAAEATMAHMRWAQLDAPERGDLHPFFYHLEGLLTVARLRGDAGAIEIAATCFEAFLADSSVMGQLLERGAASPGIVRSDVIAQAIRAGSILRREGALQGPDIEGALTALVARLEDFVGPDGALRFHERADSPGYNRNVWSAMFSYQALWFAKHGMSPGEGREYLLI